MERRNSERSAVVFTTAVKLIYIGTGLFLSLAMLMFNERFYQGGEGKADPLLAVALGGGIYGGIALAFHWRNKLNDHLAAVIIYISIGLSIGVTVISVIYGAQSLKWVGLTLLIAIPIIEWFVNLDDEIVSSSTKKSARNNATPGFGK